MRDQLLRRLGRMLPATCSLSAETDGTRDERREADAPAVSEFVAALPVADPGATAGGATAGGATPVGVPGADVTGNGNGGTGTGWFGADGIVGSGSCVPSPGAVICTPSCEASASTPEPSGQ